MHMLTHAHVMTLMSLMYSLMYMFFPTPLKIPESKPVVTN